uniref:SCP domain-containing protein n=1 Tax=Strongyloides papillosus TaxID=174720 RepID=A0A0N5B294_STREA
MNLYRRLHGSKALKLDNYLSDQAQEAAKTYIKNGKSSFRRKSNSAVNCKKIHFTLAPLLVNMWYKESRSYNYRRPGPQLQTSHFTNLIWRSTVKVGIGIVKNDSYLYICFIYSPSGNVQRKYIDNVRKARYHLVNSRSFFSTLHNNN